MRTWDNTIMLNGREDMIKQVRELCHNFNHLFSLVVLFGSTARGESTVDSDVDLYIESEYMPTGKLLTNKEMFDFNKKLWVNLDYLFRSSYMSV